MEHALPEYIETLNLIARVAVPGTVVVGLWFALARTTMTPAKHRTTWALSTGLVLAWFTGAWWFSYNNAFVVAADELPRIQYALLTPIVVGTFLLLGTERGRTLVLVTPQSWLTGVQVYRLLGFMFLALWARGQMPGEFALPAGTGDVIVGVTAPLVAYLNARQSPMAQTATLAWNVFGILDLVVAVGTGFLTAPSRLQMLALDRPNELITAYPLVMVPAFFVPLLIIFHIASLWKLRASAHEAHCPKEMQTVLATTKLARCASAFRGWGALPFRVMSKAKERPPARCHSDVCFVPSADIAQVFVPASFRERT